MTQTPAVSETTLHIIRKLAAPRELVFKARAEPEMLTQWWRAHADFTTHIAEIELRVGGKYRLGMLPPGTDQPHAIGGFSEKWFRRKSWSTPGFGNPTYRKPR